jgi:hypothetical protein
MIDTSPEKLMERVRACERVRDQVLSKFDEHVRAYHSGAYEGRTDGMAENHVFEYVAQRIGQVAFQNPVVRITTNAGEQAKIQSRGVQHALNRWCRDTSFHRLAEKLAVDSFFAFGATITKPEPVPGWEEAEDPIYWPTVARLDQRCFGFDSEARSFEEARYVFHKVAEEKKALLERAEADAKLPKDEREGWDVEVIKSMTETQDYGIDETRRDNVTLKVCYYEVWVPGIHIDEDKKPEDGYHGALFTIACDSSGKGMSPRKPRDFWGPRWGPYTLYGIYTVPNRPWPLAPVQAAWRQIDDSNRHSEVIDRSAANYKRMIIVDESDRRFAKKVKDGKHDYVYTKSNPTRDTVQQLEIGGVTEEMLLVKQIMKERADRMLGMSDAEKGMITGSATATENAIASASSNVRTSWQTKKFWDACERNLQTVAWYLTTEDTVMQLGDDAKEDFGPDTLYVGKITKEAWPRQRRVLQRMMPGADLPTTPPEDWLADNGKGVDDYEVSIEVGSMARKDEMAEAAEADSFLTTILSVGQAMVAMPHVKWSELMEEYGHRRGYPELPSYFDFQMLAGVQQLSLQSMAGGEQGGGGEAKEAVHNAPRMERTQAKAMPDSRSKQASLPGQVSGARTKAGK